MAQVCIDSVPVHSYAEQNIGPRFGIRSERTTAGNLMLHRHDYFEVWFFLSSASTQRISVREYVVDRGSIFFISPMTPHQVRFDVADSCFIIYFDLAFLRPDLAATPLEIDSELLARVPELAPFVYQHSINFTLSDADVDGIVRLCERMLAERASPRLCSEEIVRSHLVLLLSEVTHLYEKQMLSLIHKHPPRGGIERHVRDVIKFVAANPTERISLSDAARKVAVSPNYLANLLKREIGKSFVELVTEKRIEKACELLTFTSMRVSQIAYATGFDDANYFCKRFKRIAGCTPLEFRTGHAVVPVKLRSPQPKNESAQS